MHLQRSIGAGKLNLINACRAAAVKRFIFVSLLECRKAPQRAR